MRREGLLGGRTAIAFATGAAHLLAELNAIHVFRDGNGRTQLAFLALPAHRADHRLDFDRMVPADMQAAMVGSFGGDTTLLVRQITVLAD